MKGRYKSENGFCDWAERGDNMRLIDADALQLAIVEEGQANKRKKYSIGDIWELTGEEIREVINSQPTIQPEPLTDKEQRIFLATMGRERKVCKEVDDQYVHEPYEILLTKVCSEIERKVKKALWS